MSQVLGAWWTYALLWVLAMTLYTLGRLRRKSQLKKLLRHADDCESCSSTSHHDCNLQLSLILPKSALGHADYTRIQGLLQSCLDGNFSDMYGELHPYDDNWSVVSYSLSGEGPSKAMSVFSEMKSIISQEKIPYHLIAVKRLGSTFNPYAYATLGEVNELGTFE